MEKKSKRIRLAEDRVLKGLFYIAIGLSVFGNLTTQPFFEVISHGLHRLVEEKQSLFEQWFFRTDFYTLCASWFYMVLYNWGPHLGPVLLLLLAALQLLHQKFCPRVHQG